MSANNIYKDVNQVDSSSSACIPNDPLNDSVTQLKQT